MKKNYLRKISIEKKKQLEKWYNINMTHVTLSHISNESFSLAGYAF